MTTHRDSNDSAFQTHIDGLTHSSISTKLTVIETLNAQLVVEQTALEAQRSQLHKHKQKVLELTDGLKQVQTGEEYTVEGGGGSVLPAEIVVYVNAGAAASGADGTIEKPYPDLEDAMDAKIAPGSTADVVFDIAGGVYTVSKSILQNQSQNVSFQGRGVNKSIIQAGATFEAGKNNNIFAINSYGDLSFRNLTFRNCKYALVPNNCQRFTLENCQFLRCGSSGAVTNHNNTLSQNDQNDRWTDQSLHALSNGGAVRVDGAAEFVQIRNNYVQHCLRGLRVSGGIRGGLIESNFVRDISESGIYLNAGCTDFTIQDNTILNANNNGILTVENRYVQIKNNTIKECWNTGIMCWSTSEVTITNNNIRDCGYALFNGIGVLGDNFASGITLDGNSNIANDAEFQSRIFGNSIIQMHNARSPSEKIAIRLSNDNYNPGNKNYIQNNFSSEGDKHLHIDPGASMPSVIQSVTFTSANKIPATTR